ncbi:hypothetical protein COLO4_01376 [Corchorus olitorius]|uniref:Uncharacterized protein n=1 Tax=Corchorus olitorius TaxID=93759 RepID=A0A1R3L2S2_9ROSI|nr:hypothetical protein COLO4_01376 [Corchorus olitorius]
MIPPSRVRTSPPAMITRKSALRHPGSDWPRARRCVPFLPTTSFYDPARRYFPNWRGAPRRHDGAEFYSDRPDRLNPGGCVARIHKRHSQPDQQAGHVRGISNCQTKCAVPANHQPYNSETNQSALQINTAFGIALAAQPAITHQRIDHTRETAKQHAAEFGLHPAAEQRRDQHNHKQLAAAESLLDRSAEIPPPHQIKQDMQQRKNKHRDAERHHRKRQRSGAFANRGPDVAALIVQPAAGAAAAPAGRLIARVIRVANELRKFVFDHLQLALIIQHDHEVTFLLYAQRHTACRHIIYKRLRGAGVAEPGNAARQASNPAINAVHLTETLPQQKLCGAFAAVAVITHHQHRQIAARLRDKVRQVVTGEMLRASGMPQGETLWIANID